MGCVHRIPGLNHYTKWFSQAPSDPLLEQSYNDNSGFVGTSGFGLNFTTSLGGTEGLGASV